MIVTLKKRADFVHITKHGKHIFTKGMIVQATPCKENKIQFGFTASKKLGNAVSRNRIKRRLRAVVRDVLKRHDDAKLQSPLRSGMHYVLIGRPTTRSRDYQKLRADLIYALHQLKDAGN